MQQTERRSSLANWPAGSKARNLPRGARRPAPARQPVALWTPRSIRERSAPEPARTAAWQMQAEPASLTGVSRPSVLRIPWAPEAWCFPARKCDRRAVLQSTRPGQVAPARLDCDAGGCAPGLSAAPADPSAFPASRPLTFTALQARCISCSPRAKYDLMKCNISVCCASLFGVVKHGKCTASTHVFGPANGMRRVVP